MCKRISSIFGTSLLHYSCWKAGSVNNRSTWENTIKSGCIIERRISYCLRDKTGANHHWNVQSCITQFNECASDIKHHIKTQQTRDSILCWRQVAKFHYDGLRPADETHWITRLTSRLGCDFEESNWAIGRISYRYGTWYINKVNESIIVPGIPWVLGAKDLGTILNSICARGRNNPFQLENTRLWRAIGKTT